MSDDSQPLIDFCGSARLFPLPNVVLFPHVMQPLHIFEPRYRQMTADALADDRLIAMALLKPGWEADYSGSPSIFPVACLGRIVADQKLDDGRFNILLRGLCRVRVEKELCHAKLYRTAKVELLHDVPMNYLQAEQKLRRQISKLVPTWFPAQTAVLEQFRKLLRSDLPLGALCDIIGFALPLDVEIKQELLEELEVEQRVRRLIALLRTKKPCQEAIEEAAGAVERKFPPEFSVN
jgi:Lon protease-like protein